MKLWARVKCLVFLTHGVYAYLASFWSYGVKMKLYKTKIGCYDNVSRGTKFTKIKVQIVHLQPNAENRMKIRPVEVEIIG